MRGVLLRCRRRIPQTSCPACRTSTTNTGEARWMVSRRHGLRQRPSNRTHAIMRHAQAIQSAKFVWSRTAEDSAVRASHTCHRGNCSGEAQVWTPCSSQSSLSPRALVFAVGARANLSSKGPGAKEHVTPTVQNSGASHSPCLRQGHDFPQARTSRKLSQRLRQRAAMHEPVP